MRCWLTGLLLIAFAAVLTPSDLTAEEPKRLDVVEMFTSQACSACPPADEFLGRLAQRENLLALSYSVDYWNYLDWTDTLADPAFTSRQRAYAKTRGDRKVYTPQAIVNGHSHFVGSDEAAVDKALRSSGGGSAATIPIRIEPIGDSALEIAIGGATAATATANATIWLVVYADARTVTIKAGENEGKTITYRNVVRRLELIGVWEGAEKNVTIDMPDLSNGRRGAILLQEGTAKTPGRILAAARL